MASWGTHTSELELGSRLYMYCNIVKLGVYVYHTRDMWMGPDRRCETGFWYFLWHILFFSPPFSFFCAIYTLTIQTINSCSRWWVNRRVHCRHHFMLWCWCPSGRNKNKQISWNWCKTTQTGLMVWCIIYKNDQELNVNPTHEYLTPKQLPFEDPGGEIRETQVLLKGIFWHKRGGLGKQKNRTFHRPVSWNETLF